MVRACGAASSRRPAPPGRRSQTNTMRYGMVETVSPPGSYMLMLTESDDDTPDNTHTQRVLAQYYLATEGTLPSWLPSPSSLSSNGLGGHNPSNTSSASSSSGYRAGSSPVSLRDIYDSTVSNSSSY